MRKNLKKIGLTIATISAWVLITAHFGLAQEVNVAVIDSGATAYVDAGKSFTSIPANKDLLHHGTEIAKLIRKGNPQAHIYMLQVCEKKENALEPSRRAVLQAIRWSVENKIDIVNLSLVMKYDSEIEKAINEAATSHGILFIAAAGNKTISSRFAAESKGFVSQVAKVVKPAFPASNAHVISVGAKDENGQIAFYSDQLCDLYENGKILGQEGTSFACARATGIIVKLLSHQPRVTKEKVLSLLQ